jgi:small subunit ribosomal protein S6
MRLYETIYISRQDMAPSQVDALTEKFANIIRDHNGSVGKTEYCGLKDMLYKVNKSGKGHYVLMNITSEPSAIKEMERHMKNSPDVVRYLSVQVDSHQDGPSALLKAARNSNLRDISISYGNEVITTDLTALKEQR